MKKMYKVSLLLMLFFFAASIVGVMAQPSRGGTPPSFKTSLADENQPFLVSPPNVQALLAEDEMSANFAPRVAVVLPVDLNPTNSGEWITLETGETIWRLAIESEGARAITLYYSNFNLPQGSKLFIYNRTKSHVIGAYDETNNPTHGPEFTTEFVAGDYVVLEYVAPISRSMQPIDLKTGQIGRVVQIEQPLAPTIQIEGIGYAYNDYVSVTNMHDGSKGPSQLGASGPCMVNINCPQAALWQNHKKGVASTIQKIGLGSWLCSGTIVNNLREDMTPYFLMAWHCSQGNGNSPSVSDYNQWQFYFHWERSGCDNTTMPVQYKTMTGCQWQAELPLSGGSDGLLLRLNQAIPIDYDVYYNGWDATNPTNWPVGSVGIHHPAGDVKKFSIANNTTTSTTANITGFGSGFANGHWSCVFNPTSVEGGSSGSPLFNTDGNVIGSLTGGNSSCTNLTGVNLYGKMAYHFDKFSTQPVMKPFLDPDNTGARVCPGRYASTDPIANFSVYTRTPYAMQPVQFYNQSYNATSYYWEFPGGTPSTSTDLNPVITYMTPGGPHDVTLTINGGVASKHEPNYITVAEKLDEILIEIGTGTAVTPFPLGLTTPGMLQTGSGRAHTASLYTVAQLGDEAMIRSIAWNCNAAVPYAKTLRVWLEHTDETSVSNVQAWNFGVAPNGTATLVADYTDQTSGTGWNKWNFNQGDFPYNGAQNVIVYVEVGYAQNSAGGILGIGAIDLNPSVNYTATGSNTNRTWHSQINANPTSNMVTNTNLPNIQLIKAYPSTMPVANYFGPMKFYPTSDFQEGFEGTFPPTTGAYGTWTTTNTNIPNAWVKGNPNNGGPPFSTIDPTSQYSAMVPYADAGSMSNYLFTPEIDITPDNYLMQFYAYYDLTYNNAAHLEFRIATQSGSFTNWLSLWSQGTVVTGAGPDWHRIQVDLSSYIGQRVKFAWWATGADGWVMAVDGVALGSDPLDIFEIYKDELLELIDLSTGPPVVWDWDFPGSTTPAVQSFDGAVPAQYEYAGTYDLGLTVTNLLGSDSKYHPEQLIVKDREPETFFIGKGGYDAIGEYMDEYHPFIPPGKTVTYADMTKNGPDVYLWNFEGGAPATSTAKNVVVTYSNLGEFDASLNTKNVAGESTYIEEDFTWVSYQSENITNFDIPGGRPAIWTAGTNMFIGGSGLGTQIAERYLGPVAAGYITKVLTYVGGKGTGSANYNLDIVLPGAAGNPDGTQIYTQQYNINQLPAGAYPQLVEFTLSQPVYISEGQTFFVRMRGFTTYAAGTYLHYITSMGDPLPDGDALGSSAHVYYSSNWYKISDLFVGSPNAAYALWPEFTYTQLEVDPQLTLPNTAGNILHPVTANVTYTANTTDAWYTVVVESSGVRVTYTANTTGSAREGSFTVTGGGVTKTVHVLQATGALTLNVTPATQTIPYTAGSATFNVTSNVLWTVTCPALWLTIPNPTGENDGTFTVNAAINLSLASRSAIITVTGGGITKIVTLTQEGSAPYLEINPNGVINVPKMDGNRSIQITSNTDWFAIADQSWITFTQNTGFGDGFVYFSFNANPNTTARTAIITVKAGLLTETLTVIQEAGDGLFTVNPNTLTLSAGAGTVTTVLNTPVPWSVEVPAGAWYTISPLSGPAGTQNITIDYTANSGSTIRSSQATFQNGTAYRYLDLYQKVGATISWNTPTNGTLAVYDGATAISNGAIVDVGNEITVVATPATGYHLATLTVNGAPFTNNTSFLLAGATVINVVFEPNTYTLYFNAAPGTVTPTSKTVTYGEQIGTLYIPTRTGYTYTGWVIDGTPITTTTVWTYLENKTATTSWTANTYTLTFDPNGGTVNPTSTPVTYDQQIGNQNIPTPQKPGCTFNGWFIGAIQISGTTVWTYTSNQTAIAKWNYPITVVVVNPNLGEYQPWSSTGVREYAEGDDQDYTFMPNLGAHVAKVTVDGTVEFTGNPEVTANYTYTFTNITAPHHVLVEFARNCYALNPGNITNGATITMSPAGCVQHGYPVTFNFSATCANITNVKIGGVSQGAISTYTIPSVTGPLPLIEIEVQAIQYTITASPAQGIDPLGYIDPDGTRTYNCGENAIYELVPTLGARVKTLLVDNVSVPVPQNQFYTFSNISASHTIEAIFEEWPQYIIEFGPNAAQNAGGIVFRTDRPNDEYFTVVDSAANIQFSIVPDAGFEIEKVLVDNVNFGAIATYTFIELRANHTIFAIFKPVMFTINATASANGAINPSGAVQVPQGADQMFTMLPDVGAELISLTVDGVNVGTPTAYTFTDVQDNHTIFAQFAKIQYQITATAGANGTIAPIGTVMVDHGDNKTFNFNPAFGYKVNEVLIDGMNNPAAALAGYYTFINVTGPHTINVTFTKQIFNIVYTTSGNGNFSINNVITPAGTLEVAYDEHSPTLVFVPDEGYIVKEVLVDGEHNYQAIVLGEYRFLNVMANHHIYVMFAPANFTIAATASQGGAINPAGTVVVPSGTDKKFTFSANAGNKLIRVLVDNIEDPTALANGEYTFTDVEADHTIAAQFEKLLYNVTFVCDAGSYATPVNGSVSPVEYGANFMFVVDIEAAYSQSNVMVRANGIIINPVGGIYTITNIKTDQEVTVTNLTLNQYKITSKVGNNGGTINPLGITMVNYGEEMTYDVTPNNGYKIDYLVINGVSQNPADTYTFSNVKADATIVAFFKYNVSIGENPESVITVYSYEKMVTILNKALIPVQQIDIMDMYGRLVWKGQATADRTEIPLNVAAGIYTVRIITTDDQVITTKVNIN